MSLSNPRIENPCKKFIEWSGSRKQFEFYDKDVEQNVPLKEPIHIVVLDQLSTITGWDDASESGIYSNEVHNLYENPLTVKAHKGGVLAEGLYEDIKGIGKFAKSVYACLITDGNLELVNFKVYGSALGPWIDAKIGDDGAVIQLESNDTTLKKGTNTFYSPTITKKVVREDILEKAKSLDADLQEYFKTYETKETLVSVAPESASPPTQDQPAAPIDNLPF